MYRNDAGETIKHRVGMSYVNPGMVNILREIEGWTEDKKLAQSIYFGPTALTHIRRLVEMGGSIITDTMLVANEIDMSLISGSAAQIMCFIDDPQVISLAAQKHITRAEIAVDFGLTLPGLKLMVVGSAPAAIGRILMRRQREPMTDVCVLAAPTGFASVVQMKERLKDSDLASVIVRGRKGGISVTSAILNAILTEVSRQIKQ